MFRVAIIYFPGTTGVPQVQHALLAVGLSYQRVLWNTTESLSQYDAFILPAGFSFGDRIRAGVIAAHTPVMQQLCQAAQQGKPILGIGNGCNILVEAGLLPGATPLGLAGALTTNVRSKTQGIMGVGLYHSAVHIKYIAPTQRSVFTSQLALNAILPAQVNDRAGAFVFPLDLLNALERNQQILFKYCTASGTVENDFPVNPNGSQASIAGLCNPTGNVVGYIPELERDEQGAVLFQGLRQSLAQPITPITQPLPWHPNPIIIRRYQSAIESLDFYVQTAQTQAASRSAETVLQRAGFNVHVQCQQYWEVWHDAPTERVTELMKTIINSSVLFQPQLDHYQLQWQPDNTTVTVLVRDITDYIGKYAIQQLHHQYNVTELENCLQGIIWKFTLPATTDITERLQQVSQMLQTYLFYNPYSQIAYLLSQPSPTPSLGGK